MAKPKVKSSTASPMALSEGVSSASMSPSPSLSTKYGPMPTKAFTSLPPMRQMSDSTVVPSVRVAVSTLYSSVNVPETWTKSDTFREASI